MTRNQTQTTLFTLSVARPVLSIRGALFITAAVAISAAMPFALGSGPTYGQLSASTTAKKLKEELVASQASVAYYQAKRDAAQAANAKACAESPACVAKAKQLEQAEREQARIDAYRLRSKSDKPLNLN